MDENFELMLSAASEQYQQCEFHAAEMMEKSIACLSCQTLLCALCLRDYHANHEIMSVIKLRECIALRASLEDDLNELQVLQKRLQTQIEDRQEYQKQIEDSCKDLSMKLDKAFEQLETILKGKREEIRKYVFSFTEKNVDTVRNDLVKLEEKYTNSTRMIQKVISCTTKLGTLFKESSDLPQQLKTMLAQCQLLGKLEGKEQFLPERKFSKVLPSLQAVANICQTIHPEATKVVWSKVTPDRKAVQNSLDSEGLKRKRSPGYLSSKRHRGDKSPVSSRTSPKTASASTSSDSTSVGSEDTDVGVPDSSTGAGEPAIDHETKNVDMDMSTVSADRCVMAFGNRELILGKVRDTSKLQETHFISVQWFQGELGKDKKFPVSEKWIKKSDLVHIDGLICHFDFDSGNSMPVELEQELLQAAEDSKSVHNLSVQPPKSIHALTVQPPKRGRPPKFSLN